MNRPVIDYLVRVMTAIIAVIAAHASAMAGTIIYYHNDLAGSPVAATNASGQVIWRESYRPYGERTTNSAASAGNDVWFTSRRQDVESGLVYMGARYYDPLTGRFASMDPKGFAESNLHSFNRYAYANNNPYRYVDPTGAVGESIVLRGFAAIGVAIGFTAINQTKEQRERNVRASEAAWRDLLGLTTILSEGADDKPRQNDESGKRSNPMQGEPGSCSTCNNSRGEKGQERHYGSDGWPAKDIDYGHEHHRGRDGKSVGRPHAHDWGRPADGSPPSDTDRGPPRPLLPGEGA